VEDAGTGFGIKTASAANLLSLANGGILESNSIAKQDTAAPRQNTKKVFMRPLLGLANQHLLLPLWALTGNGASYEFLLQATGADAVVGAGSGAGAELVSGSTD
jgi:hypothetical protein